MNLTYKEFIDLVPSDTAEFVNLVLPYLERYLKEGRNIRFKNTDSESVTYHSKVTFLLLYCLNQNKDYSSFLGKTGFDSSKYIFQNDYIPFDKERDAMFENHSSVFNIYNDISLYRGLRPLDIVENMYEQYKKQYNTSLLVELMPRTSVENFSKDLDKFRRQEKEMLEQQIERETYGKLPISVISYLETATKIRTILFDTFKDKETEILSCTEEDIVPLSLLLSLYCNNDNMQNSEDITDQVAIQQYLKEKNITIDNINKILGINIGSRILSDTKKNVYCLAHEYGRYYREGLNKDTPLNEITIAKILNNLFDRNFTNSLVIEKIFAKQNCYIGSLASLESSIEQIKEKAKHLYSQEYVKNFYFNLSKDVKDFIEFTAKCYILLLEKMKENKHNKDFLFNEDDADTLALFIGTAYYNGDVYEFFADHGVTLSKILKILNLQLTREEIEKVKLDQKVLVDRFKRFVYGGVNGNTYVVNITINRVAHNLCNREFNRTMILENLFDEITDKIDLEKDFSKQLFAYLSEKESIRKRKLTQKLFCDMPAETMEYMELVSKIHQWLRTKELSYNEIDIRSLSLLIGLFLQEQPNSEVRGFFESKGMNKDKISSVLNISLSNYLENPVDIDLLIEQYGEYIFGGVNKGLERKDLTVKNISKNIFSKSINNSVEISRFLSKFGLDYEFFENFDNNFDVYIENTKEKRKSTEANKIVNNYNDSTGKYIRNIVKIHNRILEFEKSNQEIKQKVHDINDIIELSFVLGLFTETNDISRFFEKNALNLEYICNELNLPIQIVENLEQDSFNYNLFLENYKPFFNVSAHYCHNRNISDVAKNIFDPSFSKNSLVLEELAASAGADYDILKEEVETKRDYELSLTIDDRIALLQDSTVDNLNLDDVKSVLHFGNSLSVHSKYIHDELPKLMLGDGHDKSIATINQIIDRVYTTESIVSKKKGFFANLFALTEDEKPKVVLNPSAVLELKESINSNIESLSNELMGYDAIRKYIEVYRRKNRAHLLVVNSELEKLEEKIQTINPKDDEEYSNFLQVTSQLQIIKDKANRFNTSNHLMKQELFKVNQAIVNHFITINALETARDDLFPLLGAELAITKGRETENAALDLSQNVIGLFQSLLTRNVYSAVENMEKLKQSNLPEDIYQMLNRDIEVYLKEINQSNSVIGKIENFDADSEDIGGHTPVLTFDSTSDKSNNKVKNKRYK